MVTTSAAVPAFVLITVLLIIFLTFGAAIYTTFAKKKAKMISSIQFMNLGAMNRNAVLQTDPYTGKTKRAMHLAGHGPWYIVGILLVVDLFVLLFSGSLIVGALVLAIAIPLLLWTGFKTFGIYNMLNNTPNEKLGSSPVGLAEFNVKLATNQSQYLVSPLSKQKCSYFLLQLHQVQQRGRNTVDVVLGTVQKGVPTMLSDDSGFAVVDFSRAEVDLMREFYVMHLTQDAGNFLQRMMDSVPEARNYLMMVGSSDGKTDVGSTDTHVAFRPGKGRLYFLEAWVPVESDYYAVGSISPMDQMVNDKPLKRLSPDMQHGLMSVLPEPKEKAMGLLRMHAYMAFFLAVVITIFLAWVATTGLL